MKITLFVTETAIQFNLTSETQHEDDFMGLLKKYDGEVTIHSGVEVIETRGNYLRNSESSETITITVHRKAMNDVRDT